MKKHEGGRPTEFANSLRHDEPHVVWARERGIPAEEAYTRWFDAQRKKAAKARGIPEGWEEAQDLYEWFSKPPSAWHFGTWLSAGILMSGFVYVLWANDAGWLGWLPLAGLLFMIFVIWVLDYRTERRGSKNR